MEDVSPLHQTAREGERRLMSRKRGGWQFWAGRGDSVAYSPSLSNVNSGNNNISQSGRLSCFGLVDKVCDAELALSLQVV